MLGLTDFAESALEDALHKTVDPNDASLAIGLSSGLMDALAAANPIEGAIIRPFIRKASVEVFKAVSGHQLQLRPGASGDRPISAVKHALEIVVEQTEKAFREGIPAVVADVRRTWWALNPDKSPATDEWVFERAAIEMFGFNNVEGDGFKTEINAEAVRSFYESEARDKLKTYLSEVHPIGEERWGHKKVVLIKITGIKSPYAARSWEYAQATRRVGPHDQYKYEYLRSIDDDMVEAAQARMDAADEAAIAVVPAQDLEGFHDTDSY
jgi:hypothetical protein